MFFILFIISVASDINSLSLISPDFNLESNLSPTFLTRLINLAGFFIKLFKTSFISVAPSISMLILPAVSSAISRASRPSLPSNIPVICSCRSSALGMSSVFKLLPKPSLASLSNKSCIFPMVSSNFDLKSS